MNIFYHNFILKLGKFNENIKNLNLLKYPSLCESILDKLWQYLEDIFVIDLLIGERNSKFFINL